MKTKKVKERKLLAMGSKEIKDLSFLKENEKVLLPKIIKQYRSDKEFAELDEEVKKALGNSDGE